VSTGLRASGSGLREESGEGRGHGSGVSETRGSGFGTRSSETETRGAGRGARGAAPTPPQRERHGKRLPSPITPRARCGGGPGWGLIALAVILSTAVAARAQDTGSAGTPAERFREATRQLQAGDAQKAIAAYRDLAATGAESDSLYWNWAQAAWSRGAIGESLWALLRAREIAGADAPAAREIERLRQAANLDTAELAPDPLAAVARAATALHLDLITICLLAMSLAGHALARAFPATRWPVAAAWLALVAGVGASAVTLAGARAHPAAVVVRRGVPLSDAASPTALVLATLREGEVVPVLGASGTYLRIQDSSGARGWVTADEVWRLDRPPAAVR
jgi:hypothetical protein